MSTTKRGGIDKHSLEGDTITCDDFLNKIEQLKNCIDEIENENHEHHVSKNASKIVLLYELRKILSLTLKDREKCEEQIKQKTREFLQKLESA